MPSFQGRGGFEAVAATAGKPAVAAKCLGYPQRTPGRIAQRESARFTRGRSLVRSQVRPLNLAVRKPRA